MKSTRSIRVVIADDHTVVREGLTAIINSAPDMFIVAEARDWPEAIKKIDSYQPDVALLDARMPGMDVVKGVGAVHRKCPEVEIVILSAFDPQEEVYGVVQAGARGFLLKDCTKAELLTGLRMAHEGRALLAPGPAAQLAARIQAPGLTDRQTKILELVAEGKSNKEVGAAMRITEGTVKVHLSHIFRKLGVEGRAQAIRRALERGIVRLENRV